MHAGHQIEQLRLLGILPSFNYYEVNPNGVSLMGSEVAAPQLDVNGAGVMNSLDKHCIGEVLAVPKSHPFHGYHIAWPGTRLPAGIDASNVVSKVVDGNPWNINWPHVYFIAKPDDDAANPSCQLASEDDEDLQYLYLTVLRTLDGDFIPLFSPLLPYTMAYATPDTIPIRYQA